MKEKARIIIKKCGENKWTKRKEIEEKLENNMEEIRLWCKEESLKFEKEKWELKDERRKFKNHEKRK